MDQVDDLPSLLHAVAYPTADYAAYAQNQATLQSSLKIPGMSCRVLLVSSRKPVLILIIPSGFFNRLQEVAADRSFPKEVRLLSSLLVSREAPKKWRAKSYVVSSYLCFWRRALKQLL